MIESLYFFDGNGDKQYCPEMKTSISDRGEWLSDKLSSIGLNISQSGNVRKADEAEAMYIAIQVAYIIKEESFRSELEKVAKEYDFDNIKTRSDSNLGFRGLLKNWQSVQSVIINIIVSAAKFKISSEKKDNIIRKIFIKYFNISLYL